MQNIEPPSPLRQFPDPFEEYDQLYGSSYAAAGQADVGDSVAFAGQADVGGSAGYTGAQEDVDVGGAAYSNFFGAADEVTRASTFSSADAFAPLPYPGTSSDPYGNAPLVDYRTDDDDDDEY
jgi:hypothetical protein